MSGENDEASPSFRLYQLAWAFYLVLGLLGALWIGIREGTIESALFASPSSWLRDLVVGVLSGGALIGLWEGLGRRLVLGRELEQRLRGLLGHLDASEAIGLAVLSGFAEELFFRGAVQGSFGYLVASLLFAALHSGRERSFMLWTAFALIAGLLFGGLVLWAGNLLPAIVGHVMVNAVNLRRLTALPEGEVD